MTQRFTLPYGYSLVAALAGSSQTGYYKAALQLAEFLWFVPVALQTALLHSTSEMWSKGQNSRVTEVASRVTRYSLLFTLLLVLGLWALADELIPLYYGEEFTSAILPLLFLLPGSLGFAVARPIYSISQGKGDMKPLILASGLSALINIVLNLVLIPKYGMVGAAIATSIGYGSMLIFHGFAALRIGFNPFADLRLLRIFVAGGVSSVSIFGLSEIIDGKIVSLLLVPPTGLIIYAYLAYRLRIVDPDDVSSVWEYVPSRITTLFSSNAAK
ncbi:polysaccharide biosynthesis C-terminal domain-containing protein [Halosimplex aquaticum]